MTDNDDTLLISFDSFSNDWNMLEIFLKKRGYPPYIITDNLDLSYSNVDDLKNLIMVKGNLDLKYTNVKTLGILEYIGGYLDFRYTNTPFGRLEYVGGYLKDRGINF